MKLWYSIIRVVSPLQAVRCVPIHRLAKATARQAWRHALFYLLGRYTVLYFIYLPAPLTFKI